MRTMSCSASDKTITTGRASARLLQQTVSPDQILPVQFHEVWHYSAGQRPERALAASVLAQAAFDIEKCRTGQHGQKRRIFREAYNWVASDDRTWPYSFLNLCDTLGLSPAFLRARLLREPSPSCAPSVGKAA